MIVAVCCAGPGSRSRFSSGQFRETEPWQPPRSISTAYWTGCSTNHRRRRSVTGYSPPLYLSLPLSLPFSVCLSVYLLFCLPLNMSLSPPFLFDFLSVIFCLSLSLSLHISLSRPHRLSVAARSRCQLCHCTPPHFPQYFCPSTGATKQVCPQARGFDADKRPCCCSK